METSFPPMALATFYHRESGVQWANLELFLRFWRSWKCERRTWIWCVKISSESWKTATWRLCASWLERIRWLFFDGRSFAPSSEAFSPSTRRGKDIAWVEVSESKRLPSLAYRERLQHNQICYFEWRFSENWKVVLHLALVFRFLRKAGWNKAYKKLKFTQPNGHLPKVTYPTRLRVMIVW